MHRQKDDVDADPEHAERRCEDHSEWMRKRGTGASNAQKAAASFSACPQLIVASFNPFLPVAYKAILTSIIQIDHPNPWNSHTKGMKDVEDTDQIQLQVGIAITPANPADRRAEGPRG